MRIGLISDVHANLEGLTTVLRELERLQVERVICLGDVVGYHANPNECVELLAASDALTIAGNHDRAAVGRIEPSGFGPVARRAIWWTRRELLAEHAARLRELDVFAWLDQNTCLVHAALHPEPNDTYHLTTPARVAASCARLHSGAVPARLCFFGHTHRAVAHRSDGRHVSALPLDRGPVQLDLERYFYLINPGSVGQPRDGDRRASFAIFDDREQRVEFHRASYDVERCLRKAAAAGLLAEPRSRLGALFRAYRLASSGGR
jgi:predicted phosphodiesterase